MSHAQLSSEVTQFGPSEVWNYAIVIPARNEQRRINSCLTALAESQAGSPLTGGIVIVVNNSTDRTADAVRQWFAQQAGKMGTLIEYEGAPERASVGLARKTGMDFALSKLAPSGVILTSDADARVDPGWLASNLVELQGADLICGTVQPEAAELSALPQSFMRHGHDEGIFMQAIVSLIARLDPQPHDPSPTHRNAAGASMAFHRRLYTDVGGMPCLAVSEDREFAATAEVRDWRVRYASQPVVFASCRLTGRTGAGMAAALRARIEEADPLADELLEPAQTAILRYGLRGRLRRLWPDRNALECHLREHGIELPTRTDSHFGMLWQSIEAHHPALARVRLRQSQLSTEIKKLEQQLATMTETA